MRPHTKIICTLGPASSSERTLAAMMRAGMDVVRLNCSHSSHRELEYLIRRVRMLNMKYRRRIRILLDLEGPRIRVGRLRGHKELLLKRCQVLWLKQGDFAGTGNVMPIDYSGPLSELAGAEHIYIDDGNICLKMHGIEGARIKTRVAVGGVLREYKGVNIPGVHLSIPDITAKDREDIRFGIRQRVDMIAQSFVRSAAPMEEIRRIVGPHMPDCLFIAKIENEEGIRNLERIIGASDGVMVARGDLGVSLPIWEIPVFQKEMIAACSRRGRFSITATQMLESMVEHVRPTRAEVSDVANAILDGTDYVMLSAETAVGAHPAEAVAMMNNIIKYTERSEYYRKK